jgi:hypothetical protein
MCRDIVTREIDTAALGLFLSKEGGKSTTRPYVISTEHYIVSRHFPVCFMYGSFLRSYLCILQISGSAFFVPLFSARLRSLSISLQGYCYTSSLGTKTKMLHTVPFLHLSAFTLEETYTYVDERYEASFNFVFPEDTDFVHEGGPERLRGMFTQGPQAK